MSDMHFAYFTVWYTVGDSNIINNDILQRNITILLISSIIAGSKPAVCIESKVGLDYL